MHCFTKHIRQTIVSYIYFILDIIYTFSSQLKFNDTSINMTWYKSGKMLCVDKMYISDRFSQKCTFFSRKTYKNIVTNALMQGCSLHLHLIVLMFHMFFSLV